MPVLHLTTIIHAPVQRCFDLCRSVEVHMASTAHTNEKVIAGKMKGLCEHGDQITWEAKHFGIVQQLSVEITQMQPYSYFQDKMVKGAFKYFTHDHFFEPADGHCIVRDVFNYAAPLGILGRIIESSFLNSYMYQLLQTRNAVIKRLAESDWSPG
ncbi:MAG: cell division protein [Sphingobacteriales bacterium]|nr:MAG: cell division protein [Sphingobacteriales bacterium]